MPAPCSCHARLRNGFSLVELLVVVFIIGLLASVVALSLPSDGTVLRRSAERFAARTVAARDQAIAGGRPVALVIASAGFYFEQRSGGGWQPLTPGEGIAAWGDGVSASIATSRRPAPEAAAEAEAGAPQRQRLVFDPVGLASSDAAVRLERGGQAMAVRISRDGSVRVDAAG
jgi:general secretion pathway protein H